MQFVGNDGGCRKQAVPGGWRVVLRLKRFRHRLGLRAPQLEVRPRFANYVYALGGAAAALLLASLIYLLAHALRGPEVRDVEALQERLAQLEMQVVQGGGVLSSLEMTHSANRQLADELRVLAGDHAVLKDDLAYFMRLVPVGAREGEVRLDRLVLRQDPSSPQRYRFSVLVGYQSGRQPQEFSASLQFVLTLVRDGKEVLQSFPERNQEAGDLAVKTRHWVRKEGVLELKPGDRLKKAELRLMQGRTLRASTVFTL